MIRLETDVALLQQTFGRPTHVEEPIVEDLRPGLSDRHNDGRTVFELALSSGARVFYKPRDIGIEKSWFDFLSWLNEQDASVSLETVCLLARDGYGWVEAVPHTNAPDFRAADRFYERVGALLALLHAFEGTDIHAENLIAHGEHPVLIDLEMILYPRLNIFPADATGPVDHSVQEFIGDSVLRCGLLPHSQMSGGAGNHDASGLSSVDRARTVDVLTLDHEGTDAMMAVHRAASVVPGENELLVDGMPQSATKYSEKLCDGFEKTYRLLLRIRAQEGSTALVRRLSPNVVRFLIRPTAFYMQLQQYTWHPKFLRDGVDRSIELDRLSKRLVLLHAHPTAWPMIEEERSRLERLDIPSFYALSSEDRVVLNDGTVVPGCFTKPAERLVVQRVDSLTEQDCGKQLAIIRSALSGGASFASVSPSPNLTTATPLAPSHFMKEAVRIGERLCERTIPDADGCTTWLGLEYVPALRSWMLQPIGQGLYSGNLGVAIFLAEVARVTDSEKIRSVVRAAVRRARPQIGEAEPIGLSAADGLGAYIYALLRVGQALQDAAIIRDAERAVDLVDRDGVMAQERCDVLYGTAGLLVSLLALHEETGHDAALERAMDCGRHLIGSRVQGDRGLRAWPNGVDRSRRGVGFSHGVAGIAYALLRLYDATGVAAMRDAADEAIAYESEVIRSAGEESDVGAQMCAWCNGAPGIGLGRLASGASSEVSVVGEDLERALQETEARALAQYDHLCCGTMGRVELALAASTALGRPKLMETSRRWAAEVVRRASSDGYEFIDVPGGKALVPGLFTGEAGVGYQLMRVADPKTVPSVLMW